MSQSDYTSERRNRITSDGIVLCHLRGAVPVPCPDEAAVSPAADVPAACPAVPLLEAPCPVDALASGSFLPAAPSCVGLFALPCARRRFLTIVVFFCKQKKRYN